MIFAYLLKGIYVLACIFLILAVLLQSGKGGDASGAFGGGGSQSAFGPRGPQKPLEKATAILAAIFMMLAVLFSVPGFGVSSVIREGAAASQPITAASPAVSPVASPASGASPGTSPPASPVSSPGNQDGKLMASPSPSAPPANK
ncbi:MAG: preprotein translocase subunit SecG [Acidobacteriota bacterium]|nr:preprotein translocase subunit SecG [Acidobacteriota bacterium]